MRNHLKPIAVFLTGATLFLGPSLVVLLFPLQALAASATPFVGKPKTFAELKRCEVVQSLWSKKIYTRPKDDKTLKTMAPKWALCKAKEASKTVTLAPAPLSQKTPAQLQLESEALNMVLYGNPLGPIQPKQPTPSAQATVTVEQLAPAPVVTPVVVPIQTVPATPAPIVPVVASTPVPAIGKLTVNVASNPSSGVLVKKQTDIAIFGLTLAASAQSDIILRTLTITGQAALSGSGNAFGSVGALADFSKRVTSIKLMDGNTQVGLVKAPDTTSGAVKVSSMNYVIPRGTTKSLMVVATFSSSPTMSPGDQVAVGIASANDISAQDSDSNTVTPTLAASATNQLGATPAITQTILNSGKLYVQAYSQPASMIVMAGAWISFAQYRASAQYESISIDRIALLANPAGGDAVSADFKVLAIASNGAIMGSSDIFATGATRDIDLSAHPLIVPKNDSIVFQIWTQLANVSSSSDGVVGVRSGQTPSVGINHDLAIGVWDSHYAGNLNIRSTGADSSERIYALSGAANGNQMVIRKSQPIVTKQSLPATTIMNDHAMELFRFQVAADGAGAITWKQAVFNISKSSAIALSNFSLSTGGACTSIGAVITNAASGADLVAGSLDAGVNSAQVVVAFPVDGSFGWVRGAGQVYTLCATVSGAVAGQNMSIQTAFYRDPTSPVVTGYLTNNSAFGSFASNANIFNIDTAASPTGVAAAMGTFVWSDGSEGAIGTSGGSRDWTNDVYVQDLSQSQTLSL